MPNDWLDVHAGAIQAGSAVAVAVLTVVLVLVTRWYAAAAQRQVEEATRARRQELQPFIHVTQAKAYRRAADGNPPLGPLSALSTNPVADPSDLMVRCLLKNVGPGPALGLRAFVSHPQITFTRTQEPWLLQPGEEVTDLYVGPPIETRVNSTGQEPPRPAVLWLEYRDVFGRWWATRVPFTIGWTITGSGPWRCGGVTASDQQQETRSIPRPHLREETTAVDVAAIERDWTAAPAD